MQNPKYLWKRKNHLTNCLLFFFPISDIFMISSLWMSKDSILKNCWFNFHVCSPYLSCAWQSIYHPPLPSHSLHWYLQCNNYYWCIYFTEYWMYIISRSGILLPLSNVLFLSFHPTDINLRAEITLNWTQIYYGFYSSTF